MVNFRSQPNEADRMPSRPETNLNIIIIFVTALLAVTCVFAVLHRKHQTQTNASKTTISKPKSSHYRHEIKKLEFNRIVSGKKTLSLKIDRFSIQKMKSGFLRFALANEVHIENAHIKLYDTARLFDSTEYRRSDSISPNPENANINSVDNESHDNKTELINILAEASASLIPAKRIKKIVCYPVLVEFYDKGTMRTSIEASTATVNNRLQIVFKKNIKMISGSRSLKADRIIFDTARLIFHVQGDYILKDSLRKIKGNKTIVDIYLNPIKVRIKHAKVTHNQFSNVLLYAQPHHGGCC